MLVKEVLEEHEDARDSDNTMYWHLINMVGERVGFKARNLTVHELLINHKKYGLPNIESAGRARRKIQRQYPELKGSDESIRDRMEKELEFRDYANNAVIPDGHQMNIMDYFGG